MTKSFQIEVVVDSIETAIGAQQFGATRVELCSNLAQGGTTPSYGLIEAVRQAITIPLYVMIRPRGGDFLYTDAEYDIMQKDIVTAKKLKADGVVFGLLKSNGVVDVARTRNLVNQSFPMKVTFHRAFDMANDPLLALRDVIATGANRILTSGQHPNALEGAAIIQQLVKLAQGKIRIMPGCGVNSENIAELVAATGASEYHFTAHRTAEGQMQYRNEKVAMGADGKEFERSLFNSKKLKAIKATLDELANAD
jgi:copper homeostasis protein